MRILVTGGAGFVGSHLCDYLLDKGHEVVCVDSLFSGAKENIEHHLSNPSFQFIKHDIRKPLRLMDESIDRIYNLACPASPVQYQFDPVLTLETSVLGVQNMLKLARKTGARLLQASTSEVYGDPLEHPQKETYWGNVDPLGKRACYDEGKRAAETLCKDYREEYEVDARIIRIFNTYGSRMMFHDGRVLSNFILQALLGQDITLHGDGMQTRSFMHVDDLIEGMVRVMELGEYDGLPVNLGNPDERSIANVAELVKAHTDSKSEITHIPIKHIPSRIGDPKQRCADITRAKALLGWEPTISFEEGLQRIVVDFKERLKSRPRILVFMPVLDPEKTVGAKAFLEITRRLSSWEFDVITLETREDILSEYERINVHTLRGKSLIGKIFASVRAARIAKKMHKTNTYRIGWSIMGGRFAALSAAIFAWLVRGHVPFLLSAYEKEVTDRVMKRSVFSGWIYARLFHFAHRWQVVGRMTEKQRAWFEYEQRVQTLQLDGGWDLVAERTKRILQEIEILSTRL